jgi:hypothetical protein
VLEAAKPGSCLCLLTCAKIDRNKLWPEASAGIEMSLSCMFTGQMTVGGRQGRNKLLVDSASALPVGSIWLLS